ncbi:hypothetical protein GEW_04262, partial [Pasteurella multocida subsp. gallicida str. Anand1_poultry]
QRKEIKPILINCPVMSKRQRDYLHELRFYFN